MLDRIRLALVAPQGLIKYRKDRLIFPIFFMLFFAVLMTVGPIIRVMQFDAVTNETRAAIRENFSFPSADCNIEDAELICDETMRHELFEESMFGLSFSVYLDSHDTYDASAYDTNHIVLNGDTMYISIDELFIDQQFVEKPISEMHQGIHNLDFNVEGFEQNAFFNSVFNAINDEVSQFRGVWASFTFFTEFISAIILFLIFVSLNAFLIQQRLREVPFKQMFVMMTYASTLLFVVLIFNNLVMFNFIIFIILLFIGFRQTSRLAFEIQRRIQNAQAIEKRLKDEQENRDDADEQNDDFNQDSDDDEFDR